MNASYQVEFGLDNERLESGMDRGLPGLPIQEPVESYITSLGGNISPSIITTAVTGPLSATGQADRYVLRPRPPRNTRVDFTELERQRESREQRGIAMLWTNVSREIDDLLQEIQTKIYDNPSPVGAKKTIDRLSEKWKAVEGLHRKYLPGINESKRLERVQNRYATLKHEMQDMVDEFENMFHGTDPVLHKHGMDCGLPDRTNGHDDNLSVSSKSSHTSTSSRKKSLKRALISKMKLDLAKARAREEAEAARIVYERKQKLELRRLEEEAKLAELEWKIETEYDDENGLTPGSVSPLFTPTFLVDKQPHSTSVMSVPTGESKEQSTSVQLVPGAVGFMDASTSIVDKELHSTPAGSVPKEQSNAVHTIVCFHVTSRRPCWCT